MSRISEADKNDMYELAVEILEIQAEHRDAESRGMHRDPSQICQLYDRSDSIFCAERIKSLIDELRETQRQLESYKNLQRQAPKLRAVPNDEKD